MTKQYQTNPLASFFRPSVSSGKSYKGGKSHTQAQQETGLKRIIKLASNECPYPASTSVQKAIKDAIDRVHLYPDANGTQLKMALAEKHAVSPTQITIANGSCEILELLVLLTCQSIRHDRILTAKHSFELYGLLARNYGIDYTESRLDEWVIDFTDMYQHIYANTRIIFLANPSNPTGTVVDNTQLLAFIDKVPSTTMVVLDQAYADFYPPDQQVMQKLLDYPNLVITRTFSKAYGLAGLRIGYAIAHPTVTDNLNKLRQPFNTNLLAQHAALVALDDSNTLATTIANNQSGKQALYALCKSSGIDTLPSETNFVSIDMHSEQRAKQVTDELQNRGIIVRPLTSYGLASMVRITIGTPHEMASLHTALTDIWQALDK